MTAPIVLFCYNRPLHLEQILQSLSQNKIISSSSLIVFSDGAKNNGDEEKIKQVRKIIHQVGFAKNVRIVESLENKGLSHSVMLGVTSVFKEFEKVIVLEDDMILSEYFLDYANDALNMYEHDQEVACISGYIYPLLEKPPETFFIRGADCWGWATWKRSWNTFEKDGRKLLKELTDQNLISEFNFNSSYPYSEMLLRQIEGRNDSWAVRWYASAFLKNQLTLYPSQSFVKNTGNDKSGTHAEQSTAFDVSLCSSKMELRRNDLKENKQVRTFFENYFLSLNKLQHSSVVSQIKHFLKNIIAK